MKLEKYKLRFLKWVNRVKNYGFVKIKTIFGKKIVAKEHLEQAFGINKFTKNDFKGLSNWFNWTYPPKPIIKDDSKNNLPKYEYDESKWKTCDKIP